MRKYIQKPCREKNTVAEEKGCETMMEKITIQQAIEYANRKGLRSGLRKGRIDVIALFKPTDTDRFNEIDWDQFGAILKKKGLSVYYDRGYLRIMRA
jgi:hypothetical protein